MILRGGQSPADRMRVTNPEVPITRSFLLKVLKAKLFLIHILKSWHDIKLLYLC